jgi:hypothetical protein
METDRVSNAGIQKLVQDSCKITVLDPGITCIVHAPAEEHDVVMSVKPVEQTTVRQRWIRELEPQREELEQTYGGDLSVRSEGLFVVATCTHRGAHI